MCNFFAQADALAKGKSAVELRAENVPDHLIPHKTFTGNRPSLSILLPELNAFTTGQILAMYEHRVAVQVLLLSPLHAVVSFKCCIFCNTAPGCSPGTALPPLHLLLCLFKAACSATQR